MASLCSTIADDNGASGFLELSFDDQLGFVEVKHAYREDLPAWTPHEPELVAGMGVPTMLLAALRQLKQLGVGRGQVRRFTLKSVHEVLSVVQFHAQQRRHRDVSPHALASDLHIVEFGRTIAVQTGHTVVNVTIDESVGSILPVADLIAYCTALHPTSESYESIFAEYESDPSEPMLMGFDVHLTTRPSEVGS